MLLDEVRKSILVCFLRKMCRRSLLSYCSLTTDQQKKFRAILRQSRWAEESPHVPTVNALPMVQDMLMQIPPHMLEAWLQFLCGCGV